VHGAEHRRGRDALAQVLVEVVARDAPRDAHVGAPSAAPSAAAATLLAELGWDPSDPDALAERTGQPIGAVAAGLVELELAGLAERWVDGRYVRVGR